MAATMADFQVKVTGADVLARTLANGATMARYAFLSAGAQAVAILRGTIGITYTQNDPPPLTYIRTHNLEEGWSSTVTPFGAGGVKAIMSNPVSYAGRVIGPETQEDLFAGRWPTIRQVLEKQTSAILRLFTQARDEIVARLNQ